MAVRAAPVSRVVASERTDHRLQVAPLGAGAGLNRSSGGEVFQIENTKPTIVETRDRFEAMKALAPSLPGASRFAADSQRSGRWAAGVAVESKQIL